MLLLRVVNLDLIFIESHYPKIQATLLAFVLITVIQNQLAGAVRLFVNRALFGINDPNLLVTFIFLLGQKDFLK